MRAARVGRSRGVLTPVFISFSLWAAAALGQTAPSATDAPAAPNAVTTTWTLDLSAYDCRPETTRTSVPLHVGQVIKSQYYEWIQFHQTEGAGGRLVCVSHIKPTKKDLSAEDARSFIFDSTQIGAPSPEAAGYAQPKDQPIDRFAGVELPSILPGIRPEAPGFDPDSLNDIPRGAVDVTIDGANNTPELTPSEKPVAPSSRMESPATVGVEDRIRVTSTTAFPWNTMTYLAMEFPNGYKARCSGVLVSPYVVMTAGHCVHGASEGGFAKSVAVYPGQTQLTAGGALVRPFGFQYATGISTTQRWTEVSAGGTHSMSEYTHDIGTLKFNTGFTHTTTFMPVVFGSKPDIVNNAGYPADVSGQATQAMWRTSGAEDDTSNSLHIRWYRIDSHGGQSGSPFWAYISATNQQFLVGILSFGNDEDDDYAGGPWYDSYYQSLVQEWVSWTPPAAAVTRALTVSVNGSGTVTSSPSGISCPSTCSANFQSTQTVSLTAQPSFGMTFAGWSGACTGVGSCSVLMTNAASVTATFTSSTVATNQMSVVVTGSGTVTSSSSGISCPSTCVANFATTQTVVLTATPSAGYTFAGWTGSCTGTQNTCTTIMSAGRSIGAQFNQIPSNTNLLSVNVIGSGTVTSQNVSLTCPGTCSATVSNSLQVVLVATPTTGATFLGWSGDCSGTNSCVVAMSSARNVTATFSAVVATRALNVTITGSGLVSSSPAGISCPGTCTASFATTQAVTLTATPLSTATFLGWGGGPCNGTGACTTTMSEVRNITASFSTAAVTSLRMGGIYSTADANAQSFLRVFNTGSQAGAVQVNVADAATGNTIGIWTTDVIAPNSSIQYFIATIEAKLGNFAKPTRYLFTIQPGFSDGYVQHVLYRPADGTITNLTTCDAGVGVAPGMVMNVHSSLLADGYASSINMINTGDIGKVAALGVYNAATGVKIGTVNTNRVNVYLRDEYPVKTLESRMGLNPAAARQELHYNIKVENDFIGAMQSTVYNSKVGVTTDMTTVCSLKGTRPAVAQQTFTSVTVNGTGNASTYLRLNNTGLTAATYDLTFYETQYGNYLGTWTTPAVAAGSSPQFSVVEIERALGYSTPVNATVAVKPRAGARGYLQNVLFRADNGTLSNLSACSSGTMVDSRQLINVHSSLITASGFPSEVIVTNPSTAAATAQFGVYNAGTGAKLGSMSVQVAANAQRSLSSSEIESLAGINPAGIYHYNIKTENAFTGYLQHVMNNQQVGVRTDMTTMCAIGPDDCAGGSSSACAASTISATAMDFTGNLEAEADADYVKYENRTGNISRFRVVSSEADDLTVDVLREDETETVEQFSRQSKQAYAGERGVLWLKIRSLSGKGLGNYTIRAEQTP